MTVEKQLDHTVGELKHTGRGILLDIEGTTSPIAFVYDVMFPYVREHLDAYLEKHWDDDATAAASEQIARDAGHDSLDDWLGEQSRENRIAAVRSEVIRLMDADVKATGLKSLQGLIWKDGFESGEMKARVFDDVEPALRRWSADGRDVRIYSSGSVAAQKLFFGHSIKGDLLSLLNGHYDTTTGPKREPESYARIASAFGTPADEILFFSDVVAELDAAREAGMRTALTVRPGNAPIEEDHSHPIVHTFDGI